MDRGNGSSAGLGASVSEYIAFGRTSGAAKEKLSETRRGRHETFSAAGLGAGAHLSCFELL